LEPPPEVLHPAPGRRGELALFGSAGLGDGDAAVRGDASEHQRHDGEPTRHRASIRVTGILEAVGRLLAVALVLAACSSPPAVGLPSAIPATSGSSAAASTAVATSSPTPTPVPTFVPRLNDE